jgi:SAM-dependent methyltransferase
MISPQSIYDSPRLAAGYAFDRPAVHPQIIQAIGLHLHLSTRVARALDIGCGAGLSTVALEPLAEDIVGIEPAPAMLQHHRVVALHARFVVGQAERLPFPAATFDLMTAAGSVNYVDLDRFLPEVARVLTPTGVLVIYDFSAGRRFRDNTQLEAWYCSFEHHYPSSPGYALDVRGLAYDRAGLCLDGYEEMVVAVPMHVDAYLAYILSETRIERAIAQGVSEAAIRDWCQATVSRVFGNEVQDVLFGAYVAYVRRDGKN